ncbi:MAG: PASTA domain-containing protein [Ruminococcus sp.]|nr:PASTA domain-containing protein [Ruminococcus sp.]MBP3309743.1 PASTA domain-containing protein [Ruminococcus sp.]
MSDNYNHDNNNIQGYPNNNFQGYPDNSIFAPKHSAGNTPTPPANQHTPDFHQASNQYQGQSFQQSFPQNPFQPQNNPSNINRYPYQNNQMNGNHPDFIPPQMPKNNGKKKKNGGSGTIILILITILLILAIAGVGLYIYLNRDDDSSGGKNSSSRTKNSSRIDDDDGDRYSGNDSSSMKDSKTTKPKEETKSTKPTEEVKSEATDMIEIPAVVGLNYKSAVSLIERKGFVAELKQVYNEQYEKDRVVSQSIAPGTMALKGSKIELTVSLGSAMTNIETPNVKGLHYESARSSLNYFGFTVKIKYEFSDSAIVDYVIAQDIAPGTIVAYDSVITITVSKGPDPDSGDNPTEIKFGKVITEQDDLNVRSSPSKNGTLIGTVAKDGTVEIVSEENGWYKIKFKNSYGYVSKDYIQLVD